MMSDLYVVVRGGLRPKMLDISKHSTELFPNILKVAEDHQPSFETLGFFFGMVSQRYLVGGVI